MRTALLALTFSIALAAAETINFDSAKAGLPPTGWSVTMTHQGGPPKWEILKDDSAPSKPNVLAQTSGDPTSGRFPLCIYDKASFKDGEVSVRFKAVAGKAVQQSGQEGGIVWRYQDENNYYLVRGNALQADIGLYKVENGKRVALLWVAHPVPSQTWIKLGVSFQGKLFTVTCDDKKLLDFEDNTFTQAGKVGLWTKSDSVTYFDDFQFSRKPAETINFDSAKAGPPPADWSVAMTHQGSPPKWEILKDSGAPDEPNVLAQTSDDPTAGRFPLCIYDKASFKDGEVSIRFKAVAGKVDQAGGIVWRYQDENNYYVVRANALEANIGLYKIENGKRVPLVWVYHPVPSRSWIKMGITFRGKLFTLTFDDKKLLDFEDNTFTQAGKVGLWTKADSVTYFDDFQFRKQ